MAQQGWSRGRFVDAFSQVSELFPEMTSVRVRSYCLHQGKRGFQRADLNRLTTVLTTIGVSNSRQCVRTGGSSSPGRHAVPPRLPRRRSVVTVIELCRRIRCMVAGGSPTVDNRVADAWRRSCTRNCGTSARAQRLWNARLMLRGSRNPPLALRRIDEIIDSGLEGLDEVSGGAVACDSAPVDGRFFGQLPLTLPQARSRWPWGSLASTVVHNRIRFAASLFRAGLSVPLRRARLRLRLVMSSPNSRQSDPYGHAISCGRRIPRTLLGH